MRKIEYFNGWNKEKIHHWVFVRLDMKKTTLQISNGYEVKFADGTKYEVIWGNWKERIPTKCYINGQLAQQTLD